SSPTSSITIAIAGRLPLLGAVQVVGAKVLASASCKGAPSHWGRLAGAEDVAPCVQNTSVLKPDNRSTSLLRPLSAARTAHGAASRPHKSITNKKRLNTDSISSPKLDRCLIMPPLPDRCQC